MGFLETEPFKTIVLIGLIRMSIPGTLIAYGVRV